MEGINVDFISCGIIGYVITDILDVHFSIAKPINELFSIFTRFNIYLNSRTDTWCLQGRCYIARVGSKAFTLVPYY